MRKFQIFLLALLLAVTPVWPSANTRAEEDVITVMVEGGDAEWAKLRSIDANATLKKKFLLFRGFAAQVHPQYLETFRERGLTVREEEQYAPVENPPVAETLAAFLPRTATAQSGKGTVVAVLDSGIDVRHKDFCDPAGPKMLRANTEAKIAAAGLPGKFYSLKIPYAYNYADHTHAIKDVQTKNANYGHGMHVTGIVAANSKDGGVVGIAPDAQVLFMKIFSDQPYKTYADESAILEALDDAYKLGADVINLSFAMSRGSEDPTSAMQQAVRRLSEEGVLVVAAAGNAYYSTFPDKPLPDPGTVGTPAIVDEVLAVASYESKDIRMKAFPLAGRTVPYSVLSGKASAMDGMKLADGADGHPEEIPAHSGIVLMHRSGLKFTDMVDNAKAKGAKGVIFYNREDALDYVENAGLTDADFPVIFVSYADGQFLKAHLDEPLYFPEMEIDMPNLRKGMSVFSSYGPTPMLKIKPEITAVGGAVYSLANDNGYAVMDGTSMAAPYAAGMALRYLEGRSGDRPSVPVWKTLWMNTADILLRDGKIPYSVRRQGAGHINLEKALKCELRMTCKDAPKIHLGSFEAERAFTMTVENITASPLAVALDATQPLGMNPADASGSPWVGATLEGLPEQITLQAGEKKRLELVLRMPQDGKTGFVDGFLRAKTATQTYSIPYLGYRGDFGALPIFDEDFSKPGSVFGEQGLYTKQFIDGQRYVLLPLGGSKMDPDKIGINPKDPKAHAWALPKISLLRNARDLKLYIRNDKGDILRYIDYFRLANKELPREQSYSFQSDERWQWNGEYYDKKVGERVAAPEGQYVYVIEATPLVEGAAVQRREYPVKIDETKPLLRIYPVFAEKGFGEVSMEAADVGKAPTGIEHFLFLVDGEGYREDGKTTFPLAEEKGIYRKILSLKDLKTGRHTLHVGVSDYAGNMTVAETAMIVRGGSDFRVSLKAVGDGEARRLQGELMHPKAKAFQLYLDGYDRPLGTSDSNVDLPLPKDLKKGVHRIIIDVLDGEQVSDATWTEVECGDAAAGQSLVKSVRDNRDGRKMTSTWILENKGTQSETLTLILCAYGPKQKLLNAVSATVELSPGEQKIASLILELPEGTEEFVRRVWSDFDSLEEKSPEIRIKIS